MKPCGQPAPNKVTHCVKPEGHGGAHLPGHFTALCGVPGLNRITHCVEQDGHDGCHTYSPDPSPDRLESDELEWIKTLLIKACPDWVIGDVVTPRPHCCPFHHAASVVNDVQKTLRVMNR